MDKELRDEMKSLIRRKRKAEAEVREVKARIAEIEPTLLEEFTQDEVQNVKTDDGFTMYLQSRLWARAKPLENPPMIFDEDKGEMVVDDTAARDVAAQGLKAIGLGDFVHETFNVHSLSAYVREMQKNGETLPEGFEQYIEVTEDVHILGREGTKKKEG